MADSNSAAPARQATVEPTTFMSKVIAHFWEAYDFVLSTMMSIIYVLMQPYVFLYNLTKSMYDNFRELIKIGVLSIHAAHLYLQVWIRFLNGLNKDDKPAETVITTVKNIGTAVNNIYRRLQDEPSTRRAESQSCGSATFPPIMEVDEYTTDHNCGNDSGCDSNGQYLEENSNPPGNADQYRQPSRNGSGSGGGGSNGGSNGSGGGGTGGNGSPPVNGYGKAPARGQTVTFDPNVKGAPASSNITTGSSSTGFTAQTNSGTASSQQGVDEVDKSGRAKTSPKQTPAAPPASGAAAVRPKA